jgi:hypothetical protein
MNTRRFPAADNIMTTSGIMKSAGLSSGTVSVTKSRNAVMALVKKAGRIIVMIIRFFVVGI